MCGRGLDGFIPQWKRQGGECEPGLNSPLLRFVVDEQGCQNKCLHFLFSYVGLRGAITPEICHPKWNCWKRSTKHSGLEYDVLRLTIAANYAHGTKITGERSSARREYLRLFLAEQDQAYFQDIHEEILLDRKISMVDDDTDGLVDMDTRSMIEEYLDSPSIRRKGAYDACLV